MLPGGAELEPSRCCCCCDEEGASAFIRSDEFVRVYDSKYVAGILCMCGGEETCNLLARSVQLLLLVVVVVVSVLFQLLSHTCWMDTLTTD